MTSCSTTDSVSEFAEEQGQERTDLPAKSITPDKKPFDFKKLRNISVEQSDIEKLSKSVADTVVKLSDSTIMAVLDECAGYWQTAVLKYNIRSDYLEINSYGPIEAGRPCGLLIWYVRNCSNNKARFRGYSVDTCINSAKPLPEKLLQVYKSAFITYKEPSDSSSRYKQLIGDGCLYKFHQEIRNHFRKKAELL